MTTSSPWASPSGLPTEHAVHAAVHVALVIGSHKARVVDTRESYWHRALGGTFSPSDLRAGEALLIHCGLIELRGEDLIVQWDMENLVHSDPAEIAAVLCVRALDAVGIQENPTSEFLGELAQLVPDEQLRDEVLRGATRLFDDTLLKVIGGVGEEIVVQRARDELIALGHPYLATKVRQISLYDDTAGYDISAPCLDQSDRLFEVKSTTQDVDPLIIYLSRNEADTGARRPNWALVACIVEDIERRSGDIIGWLPGNALADYLPTDAASGTWQSARLSIPRPLFVSGIPTAVP